jgi:hypothetical protein
MRALARTTIAVSIVAMAVSEARGQEPTIPPDNERYALRAELGVEGDTNPHRTESVNGVGPPREASLLQRMVLAGTVFDTLGARQSLALNATVAAKYFDAPEARSENVAVAQAGAGWRVGLGESLRLTAAGAYYEAFQRTSPDPVVDADRRDFRSLTPTLQLGWLAAQAVDVTLTGGWRWLTFKPNRDYDFAGPTAAADVRWALQQDDGPDWETGAGVSLEHRDFAGYAYADNCPPAGLPCLSAVPRLDDLLVAHAELTRTAVVLLGAGYAFQYNWSNSAGETVMRHFAILRMAARLPGGVSLAARGELLFAFYRNAVHPSAGSAYISIEDENRSSVRVDLSRDLTDRLRLFARYSLYVGELGNSAFQYNRQTLLLSLAFTFEN